ncbi:MAG: AAA family ATPase [Chitinophagaceae bacterium]
MEFFYLFRILFKRKWIIIGATILAAGCAYFFTRNTQKKYRSNAQVSTGFTISDQIKVGNENFDIYQAETKFNNAIITFVSPSVLSLLSYTLILHDLENQVPFRVLNEKQKESPVFTTINKEEAKKVFRSKLETMSLLTSYKPEEKKLLEFLSLYGYDYKSINRSLSVYRLQRTDYIQIDYASENPELSAFIVNNLFQLFIRYYKNVRGNTSQESIDTLRSLMEKKKQDLDYKNALLGNAGGTVDISIQNTSTFDLISSFEQSLAQERTNQATLNSSLRKINQRIANLKGTPVNTVNPNNNDELLMLRKAMQETYTAYLNGGSTDKALLNRYNQLKAEYQSKLTNIQPVTTTTPTTESLSELLLKKNDIDIDIQTSISNIASLQSKINSLKGNVYQDASRGATIETLMKDADLASKEYLSAKQKYNDAIDMSSSSVNNFRQILQGQPAITPEPSKRKILVAMAGISVFLVTILIIILLAYLDSSVKTPGIFAKTVNLKLISMVNFMNLKNKNLEDIVTNKGGIDDPLDKKRHNVFRESLRKLRYEVESSGKNVFLFASTKKGQGKTTLIQALSHSLSQSKKKILIIDTNFSNNDLTLQLGATPILENMSIENTDSLSLIQQVKNLATAIGSGNILIIGSEGGDYTPSEILPRRNLLHQLNDLKQEFDYIFLEGPPLNDFSDAKELSQYVEGVIAVFSATEIIKQIDKESIKFFKDLGEKFSGAILNMVDLKNVNVA